MRQNGGVPGPPPVIMILVPESIAQVPTSPGRGLLAEQDRDDWVQNLGRPEMFPGRGRPGWVMMTLLLFLQKQNLTSAIYLFGLGTRLS